MLGRGSEEGGVEVLGSSHCAIGGYQESMDINHCY